MLRKVLSIGLVFVANILFSQCVIELENSKDTIYACPGFPLVFNTKATVPIVFEDFSSAGPVSPLWDSIGLGMYDNPCGAKPNAPLDDYHWFGSFLTTRLLSTVPLNLNYGFAELCFDFKMPTQWTTTPCEGPDEFDEGVSLQYSLDGGLNWLDIAYMSPYGYVLPSMPNNLSPTPNYLLTFTEWDQYCIEIPAQALTSNTKFKWEQFNYNGASWDHWGIDNILFNVQDLNYSYSWNVLNAMTDSLVYTPMQDTTITVTYTNGTTDTCSASVFLDLGTVVKDTLIYDTICAGQSFTLNSGVVRDSSGVYMDTIPGLNCDTIFSRNLWVTPISYFGPMEIIPFCNSVNINGNTIVSNQIVHDTITDLQGCWHFRSRFFTPNGSPINTQDSLGFCTSIVYNGTTYSANQQFVDSFTSYTNCDSVHTTFLVKQNTTITTQSTIVFCNAISFGGVTYTSNQQLVDSFISITGCDSIHTNLLQLRTDVPITQDTIHFCDSIMVNGLSITSNQQFVDSFVVAGGCDSLHQRNYVKHISSTTVLPDLYFCDYVILGGVWYSSSQTVSQNLTSKFGCDSLLLQDIYLESGLQGKVLTSDGADLANSKVYLMEYSLSQGLLYPVDSVITSTIGEYSFPNVSSSKYIKVVPDSLLYPDEITTYYYNSPVFQYAPSVYCNTYDITTISPLNSGGPGLISGFVGKGIGFADALGDAIEGVELILMRNNKVVAVEQSNAYGYFEFANLACSEYEIWVDNVRVDNDAAPQIDLSNNSCFKDSLIFILNDAGLRMETLTGVSSLISKGDLKLFPNPANNQIAIIIESDLVIKEILVIDVFGRVVEKRSTNASSLNMKTKDWSNGLYTVVVYGENNEYLGAKPLMIQH